MQTFRVTYRRPHHIPCTELWEAINEGHLVAQLKKEGLNPYSFELLVRETAVSEVAA